MNAAQAAVKKVKDATQKQSLEARIQYIANYYGLTYEEDNNSSLKQTLMPTRTRTQIQCQCQCWSSWTNATVQPQQQQQYAPAADAGQKNPSQAGQ